MFKYCWKMVSLFMGDMVLNVDVVIDYKDLDYADIDGKFDF